MKKCDSLLLKVFLYGLPVVAASAVFGPRIVDRASLYFRFFNGVTGLVLAVWMMLSLYLSVRLIVSGPLRDQVIAKLTFLRECDEREAMLTGKATRTTFLTSLAILILLFCLSCFQVSIYRVPQERAIEGKTGIVSLGFGFDLLEHPKQNRAAGPIQKNIFFYTGLPISTTSVILILIIWQIAFYNYSVRRLTRATGRPGG